MLSKLFFDAQVQSLVSIQSYIDQVKISSTCKYFSIQDLIELRHAELPSPPCKLLQERMMSYLASVVVKIKSNE